MDFRQGQRLSLFFLFPFWQKWGIMVSGKPLYIRKKEDYHENSL